jgi:hypothetical protein
MSWNHVDMRCDAGDKHKLEIGSQARLVQSIMAVTLGASSREIRRRGTIGRKARETADQITQQLGNNATLKERCLLSRCGQVPLTKMGVNTRRRPAMTYSYRGF